MFLLTLFCLGFVHSMKRNFKTLMSNWANDSHHLINNSALIKIPYLQFTFETCNSDMRVHIE
ncbi:hypothetical protein T10_3800 [Trichinella papuae]|uniref:Uncharacterized protein n=1 Tax=Trichinella papuae TaxID=268474 RepID=A0A0V1MQN5_9BILA|nr:hypothetical protein T10_3800 [Trichinella papuae]